MVSDYPPQVDCLGRTAAARHSEEEGKEDNKGHGASGVVIGYAYRKLRWSRKHKKRYIFTTKGKDKKGQARSGEGRLLLKLLGNTRFGLMDRQSGGTQQFFDIVMQTSPGERSCCGCDSANDCLLPLESLAFLQIWQART